MDLQTARISTEKTLKFSENLGLPRKQKIGMNKFWVRESETVGVNFPGGGAGPETLEKQGARYLQKNNCRKNSPAVFLEFAGPK